MKRIMIRGVLALSLFSCGWTLGRAQTPTPEFTLSIDAPGGETVVTCTKGCELQGWRDEGNPRAERMQTYRYTCTAGRCGARVNGWLTH
jgi:hypothetical protein